MPVMNVPIQQTENTAARDASAGGPVGVADPLYDAIAETMAHLPARRAALARAVAPLRAEAGRTGSRGATPTDTSRPDPMTAEERHTKDAPPCQERSPLLDST